MILGWLHRDELIAGEERTRRTLRLLRDALEQLHTTINRYEEETEEGIAGVDDKRIQRGT